MYAVIETGGKQYQVKVGDIINVEKLGVDEGEKVTFDKVIAVSGDDGFKCGAPYVDGAKVEATVLKNARLKKIIVYKYKPKKGYHKKQGHRQYFTKVKIENIG
ncbi:MAG: 50S ribosomal protein L21 [Clostridia bacterium]|nr:50S ribosomal protein L21 [Clostridia bacterium]